jgi:YggT family protein
MGLLIYLIHLCVQIYIAIIVIQVAVSWLIAFDVINASNQQAKNLMELLSKATDPVYKPLKKYVPPIGGIDITPLIVIILLTVLERLLIGAVIYPMWA